MLDGFEARRIAVEGAEIAAWTGGRGPPLLLLHGFPETRLMWRGAAPILAERFSVVLADLRGYGASSCPASAGDHAAYSKRAMAGDMVETMAILGHQRFGVAGHDRGGRVAYRMALDHPERIERLAVLDVIPGAEAWERADARLALAFWPWSLLAQPAPLPERLIGAAPEAVIDDAAEAWGSASDTFSPEVRAAYAQVLEDPEHVHAICEEYRAAADLDRRHDEADRSAGRRIDCPTLALWSGRGALAEWYAEEGGPLAFWGRWCADVEGEAVEGGHFFPEEHPEATAARLTRFFANDEPVLIRSRPV